MYTYQRDLEEERSRSWTHRLRGSGERSEIWFSPCGRNQSSLRFPSSKTKQQHEQMKEIAIGTKMENILHH